MSVIGEVDKCSQWVLTNVQCGWRQMFVVDADKRSLWVLSNVACRPGVPGRMTELRYTGGPFIGDGWRTGGGRSRNDCRWQGYGGPGGMGNLGLNNQIMKKINPLDNV